MGSLVHINECQKLANNVLGTLQIHRNDGFPNKFHNSGIKLESSLTAIPTMLAAILFFISICKELSDWFLAVYLGQPDSVL